MAGPVTRTRNRWGEGERLRLEILEAASGLLSELGDEEGLTIRGVARATGIAPASIYPHFSDRDALMAGLLEHERDRLSALLAGAATTADQDDPLGQVRAQLRAYCDFAVAHPGHYRILFRRRPDGASDDSAANPLEDILARFVETFERCERAGYKLRLPARRAGVMVFVAAHGRVALFHGNPTERSASLLPGFIDELVSLVFE
ncbi:TetR/AcrR family transcriptional regulator [Pseudonocardia acaciae]|uniref:TetR/AcrR family transcriptional regulator n=1 Tax=Pseudonocardia acaciae TaxID=551276 RepID=UPI00048BEA8A|nr:TetR/AcrR family transcriptional regulator [Pseudonocardia acaciae]